MGVRQPRIDDGERTDQREKERARNIPQERQHRRMLTGELDFEKVGKRCWKRMADAVRRGGKGRCKVPGGGGGRGEFLCVSW